MSPSTSGTAATLGPVSRHIATQVFEELERQRVVVWYDAEQVFVGLARQIGEALEDDGGTFVSASESRLRARRAADAVWQELGEVDSGPLLIYVPHARATSQEELLHDPFEAYARCGGAFGDIEGEQLRSLSEAALPERREDLARLFAAGSPALTTLDAIGAAISATHALVQQALGTEDPVEALVRAVTNADTEQRLARVPGALGELVQMAEEGSGLPVVPGELWTSLRERLFSFILVGELAADLPQGLPTALAGVPHVPTERSRVARQFCDRLRETDAGRLVYREAARRLEDRLHLAQALGANPPVGTRDTFPLQERARLHAVVVAARQGELERARDFYRTGSRSVWARETPERELVWRAVGRCLDFLDIARELGDRPIQGGTPRTLVEYYVSDDGLWRLDHAQRWFEQAAAACSNADEIDELVHLCRTKYRQMVDPWQASFQTAVSSHGWPPDQVRRQTQTFDDFVAPEELARRRVAFFLLDSLRYEMGHDLRKAFDDIGDARLIATAAALPTITPNGMAALLPGADGALRLLLQGSQLVPAIGNTALPGLESRLDFFRARYGDRFGERKLEDILSYSASQIERALAHVELLVVRSLGIDDLGEGRNLYRARKVMSSIIGEVRTAAERLAAIGFEVLVFAADHGHVLVPEIPAGDVLASPPGDWLLKKRRSLLGHSQSTTPGVRLFRADDLGIVSDVPDLEMAAATGFRTFRGGEGYFHEGLSLQECVVPVITLRVSSRPATGLGGEQVTISYRSDRFTSSVVGLKLSFASVLTPSTAVRLEAYASSEPQAARVGEAGDCDERDPITGEITLRSGVEVSVPLVIDPDFQGPSIEVRAIDSRTGVVHATLALKNARLD